MPIGDQVAGTFSGPLVAYASGFAEVLAGRGYARSSVVSQLGLMAQLSGWLGEQGLSADGLTWPVVDRFAEVMRATRTYLVSARALAPVLDYLRGLGVVPEAAVVSGDTPLARLLESYRSYLREERGLAEGTVGNHARVAMVFLSELGDPVADTLANLSAAQTLAMVTDLVSGRRPSANRVASSIRVLLRFLFLAGWTGRQLAPVVPSAASWRLTGLPGRLDSAGVAVVLAGCDRATESGRRTYAIVLLLARLGLRSQEVAALTLDDVNWRAGEIVIRGKGGRRDKLPMPWDVGQALAGYLRGREPGCPYRALFVAVLAPHRGLTRAAVGSVVSRAFVMADLPPVGPHRLRHALACDLVDAGAPLAEVGQLLRHKDLATTAIYAKVDRTALAELARPWPLQKPQVQP